MLHLGYVLLRYVLIYNLEVAFNFHLTFLKLNVIKMFTIQLELFFFLTPDYFLRAPDNPNFSRFPLKVRVIGSLLYLANPRETRCWIQVKAFQLSRLETGWVTSHEYPVVITDLPFSLLSTSFFV